MTLGQDPGAYESMLAPVQLVLGYQFLDPQILFQALTHSSFSNESIAEGRAVLKDNERLEFLGDAVIGLVVARSLMENFPDASEGKLSRWRSSLVSRKTLAEIAFGLNLGQLVFLGKGERRTGGQEKRSILAAVLEALVGAIYLDGGVEPCAKFLVRIYEPFLKIIKEGDDALYRLMDKKTHLQERTQSVYKVAPQYRIVEAWGPEHDKVFKVEIMVDGKAVACGEGRSKKEAEQHAASLALQILGF